MSTDGTGRVDTEMTRVASSGAGVGVGVGCGVVACATERAQPKSLCSWIRGEIVAGRDGPLKADASGLLLLRWKGKVGVQVVCGVSVVCGVLCGVCGACVANKV
jgi:hypothetical protein